MGELMAAALQHEPEEREAFLEQACGEDVALRREVASLLKAHGRAGPVDRLAGDIAPLAARLRKPAPSLTGRTVGRYRVHERIGGGGMGVVYRASGGSGGSGISGTSGGSEAGAELDFAIKVLKPSLDGDPAAPERFRQEARTVAALDHPNICTVHEIGETDDGRLFIVMPLYEGETLNLRIARGALAPAEAVQVAVQVARALANVHARGIIHRDVKPSNVMITAGGVVKLLDFGIAKLAGVSLTGAAAPPGTMSYMSPEQLAGKTVDARTDVWSLGVVLYEMLAGRHPFRREGQPRAMVVDAIRRGEPERLGGVGDELARIVARAMAKSRRARYPSAEAMERELARCQHERSEGTAPTRVDHR
jgi:serine/threonine-protein kinase